jgi:hypothetical protein
MMSWDAVLGAHQLEILGKLLEMMQKAKPADLAGFVSCGVSLNRVAGGRADLDRTATEFGIGSGKSRFQLQDLGRWQTFGAVITKGPRTLTSEINRCAK